MFICLFYHRQIMCSCYSNYYIHPVSVRRFPSFLTQPLEHLTPLPMKTWISEQPSPWIIFSKRKSCYGDRVQYITVWYTPNPPTNIARLKLSGNFPIGLGIPPLSIKIVLESNPRTSTMLAGRLGVYHGMVQYSRSQHGAVQQSIAQCNIAYLAAGIGGDWFLPMKSEPTTPTRAPDNQFRKV